MSALRSMGLGLENPLGKTEALFSLFNPPGPEVSNDSFQFEKANCGNCETSPGLDGCTMQWVGESCMSDPKIGVLLMQQVVRQVRGWINEDYDEKRDIAL